MKNYTIYRSRALFSIDYSNISLLAIKILEIFLALINPFDVETRTQLIEVNDIYTLLQVNKINNVDLKRALSEISRIEIKGESIFEVVKLIRVNRKKTIKLVGIIDSGIFFNLKSIGYEKYNFFDVIFMRRKYSLLLLYYCIDNRFRTVWEISIKKLRDSLSLPENTYRKPYDLKRYIINPAVKEIKQYTNYNIIIEDKKSGNCLTDFRFFVEEKIEKKEEEKINKAIEKGYNFEVLFRGVAYFFKKFDTPDEYINSISINWMINNYVFLIELGHRLARRENIDSIRLDWLAALRKESRRIKDEF